MTSARKLGALALGVVAALAWTIAADISFDRGLHPVRPLYDGGAPPPPYRWVNPPAAFAADNEAPQGTTKTFDLSGERSPSQAISSEDTQASIVFSDGALEVPAGATAVEVTITPLDTEPLPSAPKGFVVEGNAYRFEAVYLPSREPVRFKDPCPEVTSCGTVILRWPIAGTVLYRLVGDGWTEVKDAQHLAAPSFQIYGNVEGLGTYAAAGAPVAPEGNDGLANTLALALGVIAVIAAIVASRFLPARRAARAKQAAAKKRVQSKAARRATSRKRPGSEPKEP